MARIARSGTNVVTGLPFAVAATVCHGMAGLIIGLCGLLLTVLITEVFCLRRRQAALNSHRRP